MLKNTIKLSLCLAALTCAFGFTSCNDEEEMTGNRNSIGANKKGSYEGINIDIISYNNGIDNVSLLEFRNTEDFLSVYEFLTEAQNTYEKHLIDSCLSHDPNLTYIINDSIGLDEYKILKEFERSIDFNSSMLKDYIIRENAWLNETFPSDDSVVLSNNNPYLSFPFDDANLALLNTYGEVKIGDTIVKYTNSGCILITDGDFNTLLRFNNGDTSVLSNSNVIAFLGNNQTSSECASKSEVEKMYRDYWFYGLKIINYLKVKYQTNFLHYAVTSSVLRSFILLYNSNKQCYKLYKLSGIKKEVHAWTQFYDNHCYSVGNSKDDWDDTYKHKVTVMVSQSPFFGVPGPLHFKKNESVWGGYKFAGHTEQGFFLY